MRKLLIGAIAGAAMLAVAAIAFAATETTYSQSYSKNKVKSSVGTIFKTSSIDTANTAENQQPKKTRKLVITFPAGTKIDQGVKPYCAVLHEDQTDPCPKNTKIGTGTAEVRVKYPGFAPIPASVTAYNKKKGLWLYVVPSVNGQAPVVIQSNFQGLKLITNLKPNCVLNDCAKNGEAVLTKFELTTKAFKKGKGKKTRIFFRAPANCPKAGWLFTGDWTYSDATTEHKESRQACKK